MEFFYSKNSCCSIRPNGRRIAFWRGMRTLLSMRRIKPPPSAFKCGRGAAGFFLFVTVMMFSDCHCAVPHFDEANRMGVLLLPKDIPVDSIIYRLRGEDADRDYPLEFRVSGPVGKNLIYIDHHECETTTHIFCDADVYLKHRVEPGRKYFFNLTVTDTRGSRTSVRAFVEGIDGRSTPLSEIFVNYAPTIVVKEDMPPRTPISTMTVQKRNRKSFGDFEVLGPAKETFSIARSSLVSPNFMNGTLSLRKQLDFETANLHTFKVCLLEPYTYSKFRDTRNIACVLISIVVEDVQDEPPVFFDVPPVTRVNSSAVAGQTLTQIKAKDGDRGTPREIRFSMVPATSLYATYFKIDSKTGVITMNESAVKLREKLISLEPILITVIAEEATFSVQPYPALSAEVLIAFVVLDAEFLVPKFVHESYIGEVYENSIPDTEVSFKQPFLTQGMKGSFSMELLGDNGAFQVHPVIVNDAGPIKIMVRNQFLIDYEKTQQFNFKLLARQLRSRHAASSTAEIIVRILDVNDNSPEFSQTQYEASIFENIQRGSSIIRVHATDEDTGEAGVVRYTNIYGTNAEKLYLDPQSGLITCATENHGFDREEAPEYIMTIEAKDMNGKGSTANMETAKLIIRLRDINDSPPRFVEPLYKGVMASDLQRLKDPIHLRAIDDDAERPNNEVVYDIMRSSYSKFFYVDRTSGRLDINPNYDPRTSLYTSSTKLTRKTRALLDNDETVISLTVRASDQGNPPLSDIVEVKIFKQEYGERIIDFIYPKSISYIKNHRKELERTLNTLTGGSTKLLEYNPIVSGYFGQDIDPTRSKVRALVRFNVTTVIDVERLMTQLNSSEFQKLQLESNQKAVMITELEDKESSYIVGVVLLCVFLAIVISIFVLCFFCEGCPLYRASKSVGEDGAEGVSYVRVEDSNKYRGVTSDISTTPNCWQMMPLWLKDILLACGYIPPGRKGSRLAWSGHPRERQTYGKVMQQPEVDNQAAMVQAMQRQQQSLRLEDMDPGRSIPGQLIGGQPSMPQPSDPNGQEPRRVFVLKDAMGVPSAGEALREGSTYLLEDIENKPRNGGLIAANNNNNMYNQGNGQALRPHASPHDVATINEGQRVVRRADVGTEGAALVHNGQTGNHPGFKNRVNGQNYSSNENNFEVAETHGSQKRRGKLRKDDEYHSLDTDRSRSKRNAVLDGQIDRATDPLDRNTKSARASNIPGTYGYQHTKASILRYETNKAKIGEAREELIRQGKDPDDYCITHQGGGYVIMPRESKKGSTREGRSVSKLENRRSQSQFSMPGEKTILERRSSLNDIETNLEREAAKRNHIRRNSGGMQDDINGVDEQSGVNYQNENLTKEEIEKRRLQRRTEASEALSEDLRLPLGGPQTQLTQLQLQHLQESLQLQQQQLLQLQEVTQLQIQQTQSAETSLQYQQPPQNTSLHETNVTTAIVNQPPQEVLQNTELNSEATVALVDDKFNAPSSSNIVEVNQSNISNERNIATKESIHSAVASALVNMATSDDNGDLNVSIIPSTSTVLQNDLTNVQTQNTLLNLTDQNIHNISKIVEEKSIMNNLNTGPVADMEINESNDIEIDPTAIYEKNLKNDSSILNIPKDKKKRNKMLEKKSVFTIAYDGMKTDQLRPESAPGEP